MDDPDPWLCKPLIRLFEPDARGTVARLSAGYHAEIFYFPSLLLAIIFINPIIISKASHHETEASLTQCLSCAE